MTKIDVQNIVLNKLAEKLTDTTSIRDRIDVAFEQWFRGNIMPPEPTQGAAPPDQGGGGEAAPPEEGAPPE